MSTYPAGGGGGAGGYDDGYNAQHGDSYYQDNAYYDQHDYGDGYYDGK